MKREDETEVLVVGAGPVGLWTSLALAGAGVGVKIIDEEEQTASHSYACALHPRTLKLLDRLDLAEKAVRAGHRIETIAFYDGSSRRAEMDLSKLGGGFPFVLVLPQDALEELLEESLASQTPIRVNWNQRLADFQADGSSVTAAIDQLGETMTGYGVPHGEWVVEKTRHTRASFLVGADGHDSLVRRHLGIDYKRLQGPEVFAVYEFETEAEVGHEMRVILDEQTTNVFWPIADHRCRWSFQLRQTEEAMEFPRKERMNVRFDEAEVDEGMRKQVQQLILKRAPWFKSGVKDIHWTTMVQFEHRLAARFGQGNCFLIGDAAHQTGPAGMQSLNGGINEAAELVERMRKVLRENAPASLLESYDRVCRSQWERLLGINSELVANAQANPWTKQNCARMLPCIPASGADLTQLLSQVGLVFQETCSKEQAAAPVPVPCH